MLPNCWVIFFASLGSKFKVPREGGTEWLRRGRHFGLIHHDCTRVERDSSPKGKQDARLENEEKVLSNHNQPQLLSPLHSCIPCITSITCIPLHSLHPPKPSWERSHIYLYIVMSIWMECKLQGAGMMFTLFSMVTGMLSMCPAHSGYTRKMCQGPMYTYG